MDLKFAGKPVGSMEARPDIEQMADTPTRRSQHRRAHSETTTAFFRFPDLDDILIDDLNLDLPPTSPTPLPNGHRAAPPPHPDGAHLRSLSMDSDFFEGLGLDAQSAPPPLSLRHRHSNSMDGYTSPPSFEAESAAKKAMASDRLAEIALFDPKRAKRILANRQSAARSKERKIRYTSELEKKVQTLQAEATKLSAEITLLQRGTTGLTNENKELKIKLQGMEQQAHLRDELNDALRSELVRLKISAAQVHDVNGNKRV